MSDEGEKTCPLCAEEMDLTDQQLKPCRCGYDICVWCWHHIMDMAEKDDTEGRCPACRTPYNKEKIVGTASKCERLVAEMSVEKKHKSLKGKTKTSEGRKQLSSVRVIQRNLVYIVGLPLNLADEDLLQRKDYFGQYGKVLKVSISRTASGSIQHFANNTCSVYITYSKEDEAVRSIQSVHGYVLEGRPLRACFGTTKYCHAWLRNMPCTNPDCLYLHEFGLQEDSFTKDEIISEYTRGRVQQVTGTTNEIQRRSGNFLPPAVDDYSNNTTPSWPKPISKSPTNETTISMKSSPPNSSSGRSIALPAAASWGTTHASNSQPVVSSNGSLKQKADTCTTTVVSPSLHSEESNGKSKVQLPESSETLTHSSDIAPDKDLDISNGEIQKLSSDMSSIDIGCEDKEIVQQPFPLNKSKKAAIPIIENNNNNNNNNGTREVTCLETDLQNKFEVNEVEADLLSFNDQRLRDPEVVTNTNTNTSYIPQSFHYSLFQGSNGHSYFPTTSKTDNNNGSIDLGENSIISNILSMEFDPWDESLTSPQNLAKLLGNNNNKQERSQLVSSNSSRKTQNCNQSRFSFAREEDSSCIDQVSNFTHNFTDFGHVSNTDTNGFSSFNFEESDSRTPGIHSNKLSVSRSQISAPPGFMGPSRAPPPGFTSNERIEQTYDNLSGGNHMFESCSILRKMPPVYNGVGGVSEVEFMDPAILAIGGSSRVDMMRSPSSNFSSHYENNDNNSNNNRLRLLMQTSFTNQNQRFSNDLGGPDNNYGLPSRILQQTNRSSYQQQNGGFQQPRMSNGHWDSWNEVQNGIGNGNERLGYNKYYSGYEDTKFRMPSSGDLYNRTFGI